MKATATLAQQIDHYKEHYARYRWVHEVFRFDVRYRKRRLQEILREQGLPTEGVSVLDVGFGWGDMLKGFDKTCAIHGADISPSAVATAQQDEEMAQYREASFFVMREDDPEDLPAREYDYVLSSHTLEHVFDDRVALEALRRRVRPGGHLVVFVPIEKPDYSFLHLRHYSVQSITERVRQAGLRVRYVESSMHVDGHVFRWLSIPARRGWPGIGLLASGLRLGSLSLLPYPVLRFVDRALYYLDFAPGQALVIAQRPPA